MQKQKPGGAAGASTPQEVEETDRQPGGKGAPGQAGAPELPSRRETGVGQAPPGNNSAPGTGSRSG
ncbi:MAG: hypothetical protein ABJC07_10415 [Acidobacteriota bacterium]